MGGGQRSSTSHVESTYWGYGGCGDRTRALSTSQDRPWPLLMVCLRMYYSKLTGSGVLACVVDWSCSDMLLQLPACSGLVHCAWNSISLRLLNYTSHEHISFEHNHLTSHLALVLLQHLLAPPTTTPTKELAQAQFADQLDCSMCSLCVYMCWIVQ